MKNNKALKILFTYNSLFIFSATLLGPLYAVYVNKIGGGLLLISISSAAFFVSSTLFLMFVSRWGDLIKRRDMLLAASYFVRAVGYLAFIFVGNALWLILVQVLLGLADALGTPTFGALFAAHVDKKEEVMEYSDWSIVANLVMALGTLIGGYITALFGFDFLFFVMSLLCVISGVGILTTPRKVL